MSSKDKKVEDLVVSYNFPPSTDVSGIILAKRIIEAGEKVDLLKVSLDDELDHDFESLVNEYINEKKSFEMSHDPNFLNGIKEYVEKGLETIEEFNKDYKSIKSRSWPLATHFLSFEYKLKNPDVFWKAEFSDPLLFNIYNEKRDFEDRDIKNQDYIDKVNCEIRKLNKEGDHNFPELEYGVNAFLLSEYLPFLFADEILFTNSNQREVMLKQFPFDVYDFVMKKSIVKRHPTLDESFYHVKDADIELDSDSINIGYFGTFIGKRHFEYIFYAFETLNHKFKDKIKFYLYVSDADFLKDLSKELEIANNIKNMNFEINGKKSGRFKLTVSVSNFVPKADTPFQWEPQDTAEEFRKKHVYLAERLRSKHIVFNYHDNETSSYEAVFARGDRRTSKLLYKAWELGCKLDGWSEHYRPDLWDRAFEESGVDRDFYTTRKRSFEEILPWDIIDCCVSKEFFKREALKAYGEEITPDCRYGCAGCGINRDVKCEKGGIYNAQIRN